MSCLLPPTLSTYRGFSHREESNLSEDVADGELFLHPLASVCNFVIPGTKSPMTDDTLDAFHCLKTIGHGNRKYVRTSKPG